MPCKYGETFAASDLALYGLPMSYKNDARLQAYMGEGAKNTYIYIYFIDLNSTVSRHTYFDITKDSYMVTIDVYMDSTTKL